MNELNSRRILIVLDHTINSSNVMLTAIHRLRSALADLDCRAEIVDSYAEAIPLAATDMDFDVFLLAAELKSGTLGNHAAAGLYHTIRNWQREVPLFLLADREFSSGGLATELLDQATELIWILEDSPEFIAGRIHAAIGRFRDHLLPPLMQAVWQYNETCHEYSWAAPGHQGGRGFTKTQSGKKFFDFYGENLFRTDTGIERSSIGSLLDHTGAFAESEKMAAKIFGADISYSGIVGTSGSNRSIMQAVLGDDDIAICDRNCHKSIEQGLINTGASPVYLIPTRNRYGIIGPVLSSEMSPGNIARKIADSPLKTSGDQRAYAVLTNCTYDGLCYNAAKVEKILADSADRIHFDEAWYAYAKFNPLYQDHYAMRNTPRRPDAPTVFATHSTHKLLAALSQASYIHMRCGKKAPSPEQLNQGYLLNSSTSPLYAICASNDIAAKMMAENGIGLTGQVIDEAVDFRQALAKMEREFTAAGSWFFKGWNPPQVTDPETGKVYDFADAPKKLLTSHQECWRLRPGEKWHGFEALQDDDWVMLDPIKVSILAPGMGDNGEMLDSGIPAALVSAYIYQHGIVPTRTTDFQLMFLFSIGITRGKWATLLNALLKFKRLYDANTPVSEVLPEISGADPKYHTIGIRDLGEMMFAHLKKYRPGEKLNAAFETLPEQAVTPRHAYLECVRGNTELVPADQLAHRIAANALIPYPPGIPMVMSGERFGGADNPHINYLRALEAWDSEFPGFEHITEGTTVINGVYHIPCLRQ